MTVEDLINKLMNLPMDAIVEITGDYTPEISGYSVCDIHEVSLQPNGTVLISSED